VGNGDVDTADDQSRRSATVPGGVMVGRGAVRRPWIFAQAKSPGGPRVDLLETTEVFLDSLELHQPPEFYRSRSQRFFFYFLDNLTWAHHIKTLVARQETLAGKGRVIKTYLDEYPEDRYPTLKP
jgi:tRNA-dihydrouridine synthase